jgi:hypothetical protein
MTVRHGSCHCGTVKFVAEFPDERLVGSRCNCSICAMKGSVGVYVPVEALTVTEGRDQLSCYQFNTLAAKHHFCSRCGIHCFHQARSDPDKFAINAATLEGVRPYEDFPEVPVFNGQRHVNDHGGVRTQAGWLRFEETPGQMWPDGVI